jgi:hypothetical protein
MTVFAAHTAGDVSKAQVRELGALPVIEQIAVFGKYRGCNGENARIGRLVGNVHRARGDLGIDLAGAGPQLSLGSKVTGRMTFSAVSPRRVSKISSAAVLPI